MSAIPCVTASIWRASPSKLKADYGEWYAIRQLLQRRWGRVLGEEAAR